MEIRYGPPNRTLTVKRPAPQGPRLILVPAEDRLVWLREGPLLVGASAECGLVLDDPTVSRIHCELRWHRGKVTVQDLGSKNGLILQGVRVSEGEVQVGNTLRLGNASLLLLGSEPGEPVPSEVILPGMVGVSPVIRRMARTVRLLAPSDLSVLVLGETGTGKELVARALHRLSPRSQGPFETVNCGAIPRDLIESELFGHEKGAFTGAVEARPGIFELAAGGTLLLDEIGELPLDHQPKLLRVLESHRVRRVGGKRELEVDVRVVAATHVSLPEAVQHGQFRRDLFYRVNEAEVHVPALARRPEDIPVLVRHFLAELPADAPHPDAATLLRLQSMELAGNVRELRSLVRRAAVLGWSEIECPTFPAPACDAPLLGYVASATAGEPGASYSMSFEQIQRRVLEDALAVAEGNKAQAARMLDMPKSTFNDRLRRLGVGAGAGRGGE